MLAKRFMNEFNVFSIIIQISADNISLRRGLWVRE